MLPKSVTFSIASDIYIPGLPERPDPRDPTGELGLPKLPKQEEQRFGEAFAGDITCRIPTAIERRITIPAQCEATLREAGFKSVEQAPYPAWEFANARAFFALLAPERPAWLTDAAAGDAKSVAAFICAYRRATEKIDQGNASSDGTGAGSSDKS